MRKIVGIVLLGLSGFLLLIGLMALIWAPGKVEKTPLDVNSTTRLSGEAAKLNTSTNELERNPVKATSVTKTDSKASTDDVAVFVNTSCLVVDKNNAPDCVDGDDPRLVTATTDVFATDRVTALAVDGTDLLPSGSIAHEGIINKFPFDTEKKDYPYWDGTFGAAVPAVYDRTENIEGIDTYVYVVTIKNVDIEIAAGVPGTYDDVKEIYVVPRTGAILNQTDDQQRYLADGTQVLDLQLAFTPDQVKESAADSNDDIAKLNLITKTVPIVGLVGGLLALVGGLIVILGSRKPQHQDRKSEKQSVGV